MLSRFCAPFVRDVLREFRAQRISAAEAASQLAISKRRLYQLYASFLRAVAARNAEQWSPRSSGGNHQPAWTPAAEQLVRKLLKTRCSYSLIASELLRRLHFEVDRATIRRFALRNHLAPASPAPRAQTGALLANAADRPALAVR